MLTLSTKDGPRGTSVPIVDGPAAGTVSDYREVRGAFRLLSPLQRELLAGLHAKTTTVDRFSAERDLPPKAVRALLAAAMRHLAEASGAELPSAVRRPWDEQRRGLIAALASAEVVMDAERRALELIIARSPLTTILDTLTRTVEECSGEDSVAAILLTSPDGRCLFTGSAPGLPATYNAAIDGLEIVPDVGTCLAAAAAKRRVVTPDIAADPHWAGLSHLPLDLGLRAAWSQPILGTNDILLGTFGTYFRTARKPTPAEFAVVTVLSHMAAIAIEREVLEAAAESDRDQLRALNRDLSATNASMDEFISLVSHELLTPLSVIEGDIAYLREHGGAGEVADQLLMDAHASAARMARTVSGLAVLARSGPLGIDGLEPFRVGRAVQAICARFSRSTAPVKFTARESALGDIVTGSLDYLDQIVVNLLSNAAKYGRPGDCIEVSVESGCDAVFVTVSDRGTGIPAGESAEVFAHSFRGAEAKRTRSGLGIGLTVCKRLAQAMQGDVSFRARDGGGTEFVLTLPRTDNPDA